MAITSSTAAIIGITAAAVSAAGAGYTAYTNYQNAKAQEDAAKYNAKVAHNQALQAQMEQSVSEDRLREDARRKIAAGRAAMIAGGNIGPASQGAELNALSNLDEDLAINTYNYGSRATAARNQQALDIFSGKVASKNAVSALVSGGLNVTASLLSGASMLDKISPAASNVVDINGNVLGKVGGYGIYQGD